MYQPQAVSLQYMLTASEKDIDTEIDGEKNSAGESLRVLGLMPL